jgi:hypothetical protein
MNSRHPKDIFVEMDLAKADGTVVIWDEKRVWKDWVREWVGRNRTANFLMERVIRIWPCRTPVDFSQN